MLLDDQDSQLVLVDYQARLMPAIFEGELVLANAMRLAQAAHWMEVPTFGTEQTLKNSVKTPQPCVNYAGAPCPR